MVYTRSNMQLTDLNSKPHGGKSLRNLIDCAIGVWFYPPPVSLYYQKIFLGQFYEPNHINCEKNKKSGIKIQQHPVHAIVLQNPAQIRSKNTAQLYYFIYTDVNTQMITNHPRISIQIYFICANTITGYQCITRAVKIIRKSRLMLLWSVVLHYIWIYTCTH